MERNLNRPFWSIRLTAPRKSASRSMLLVGVSALALLLASQNAMAASKTLQALSTFGAGNGDQLGPAGLAASGGRVATARATGFCFARAAKALQSVLAVQATAHSAAVATSNAVPNGLLTGGLDPAVPKPATSVPNTSPNPAVQDPTGILTWEGAILSGRRQSPVRDRSMSTSRSSRATRSCPGTVSMSVPAPR